MSLKDIIITFFSSLISIILGIVVTFAVQARIDRAADRNAVRSALELVRTELQANKADIGTVSAYLREERGSAAYFLRHLKDLPACPEDSVSYHSGIIFADVSLTTCQDALELLKMSSLFQKIDDNPLSMKIIRAYDACEFIEANLNRFIAARDARFESSVNEQNVRKIAPTGYIDMRNYLRTDYGVYSIRWLMAQGNLSRFADVSDLDAAIEAIDAYLGSKSKRRR